MRGITFTDTHTGNGWGLVLTAKSIPRAEVKESLVEVEGKNGNLDFSEAFGDVKYNNRTLKFSFSMSSGTYATRETLLNTIVQKIHGKRHTITIDDDTTHYFSGRCKVDNIEVNFAYTTFDIEVDADPWYYSTTEKEFSATLSGSSQSLSLVNGGRMACVPTVVITGSTITVSWSGSSYALSPGTYTMSELKLESGTKTITVNGTGTITVKFREAIL